jgi:hypothetical protein
MSLRSRFPLAIAALVAAGTAAPPAVAELAILVDGSVLKVEAYEVHDRKVRFELPAGGQLTLSIQRVERIVDDEIVPEEERIEEEGEFVLAFSDADEVPETPYGELIYETARRYDLSARLVAAMVRAESAFDPGAVSSKGARGLLQLMPATAERFGVKRHEIHDPERNLEGGVKYLKWLATRFSGDLPRILAGYNAGEGTVDRYDGVPPFRETTNYIKRIFGFLGLDQPLTVRGHNT